MRPDPEEEDEEDPLPPEDPPPYDRPEELPLPGEGSAKVHTTQRERETVTNCAWSFIFSVTS